MFGRGLDALGDVSEDFLGAKHAVGVETGVTMLPLSVKVSRMGKQLGEEGVRTRLRLRCQGEGLDMVEG